MRNANLSLWFISKLENIFLSRDSMNPFCSSFFVEVFLTLLLTLVFSRKYTVWHHRFPLSNAALLTVPAARLQPAARLCCAYGENQPLA